MSGERLFLAVALTEDARHGLATRLGERLGRSLLPGRPVPPPNWHVTLRFLGATGAVQRDTVLAHLDQHLEVAPFRLRFDGLGAFPRSGRAAVLWIGVAAGSEELTALAAACEAAAVAADFEPEGRPFHPHVTIARIRPPQSVEAVVAGDPLGVPMDVGGVTLYRSVLGRGPARYEAVETIEL